MQVVFPSPSQFVTARTWWAMTAGCEEWSDTYYIAAIRFALWNLFTRQARRLQKLRCDPRDQSGKLFYVFALARAARDTSSIVAMNPRQAQPAFAAASGSCCAYRAGSLVSVRNALPYSFTLKTTPSLAVPPIGVVP